MHMNQETLNNAKKPYFVPSNYIRLLLYIRQVSFIIKPILEPLWCLYIFTHTHICCTVAGVFFLLQSNFILVLQHCSSQPY